MKNTLIVAMTMLAVVVNGVSAQKLPPKFSYTLYVRGERVGTCETVVTEADDAYILESRTSVNSPDFTLELTTRTEADKETFLPRQVYYTGTRRGKAVEADFVFDGESVSGHTKEDGQTYMADRKSTSPKILVLEDFVMAHEVLIARAFFAGGEDPVELGLFFPSGTRVTPVRLEKGSEIAIESETAEAICDKIVITISGSGSFVSYFSPDRGLPVYLAFPGTFTEVFLDEFFGDKPVVRYRAP